MTDEYEKEDDEEYEDEEVSSESEEEYDDEAEDAEDSEESEDSVASWGYEEKKSRFSKEVIAGFAAVALLLTVFGVVVYKKFPGADESTEVVSTGPEASLNNPEGAPPEADPNDPFAEGAGLDPGRQSEPGDGQQGGPQNAGTGGQPAGDGSGSGTSLVSTGTNNQVGVGDPFASDSETTDLFASRTEPGTASSSGDLFGNSGNSSTDQFGQATTGDELSPSDSALATAPGGQAEPFVDDRRNVFGDTSSEFADAGSTGSFPASDGVGDTAGSADPLGSYDGSGTGNNFDDPGLTDGTGVGSTDFGSTGIGSTQTFSQSDQFAQNDPSLGGSTDSSFPGNSESVFPSGVGVGESDPVSSDPFGGPSTSMTSEPFGSTSDSSTGNDPFGAASETGNSEPGGLFDREPGTSLSGVGLNDAPGNSLSNDTGLGSSPGSVNGFDDSQPLNDGSQFGSTDNGLSGPESAFDSGTSPAPFGSNESLGSSNGGTNNDPFGSSSSELESGFDTGNDFNNGASESTTLFSGNDPGLSSAEPTSNDPFQPPLTSSPEIGSSVDNSAATTGPFGSDSFGSSTTVTSSTPTTFASQPANSGTYTIEAGDSYWNISKKVYGTAKYFQVLADYNRKTIPDPQKMKTGAVVQTPDASILQSRLKTVRRSAPTRVAGRIETTNRTVSTDSAGSRGDSVVVSRRPTTQVQPSGILFNQQGYPMYRIGETDTLTSIAADHLGRASRWEQVYNMNRDQLQSPDKLQIGMLLKLPADASRVPLVDRTSSLR